MSSERVPLLAGLVAAGTVFGAVTAAGGEQQPRRAGRAAAPPTATAAAQSSAGRALFAREGCGSCHALAAAGSTGFLAPDLDAALPGHTRASLKAKIVRPGDANIMPKDYAARMTGAELDALAEFLLSGSGRKFGA